MEHLSTHSALQVLCKAIGQWGMYISFRSQPHLESHWGLEFSELEKAIPYFDPSKHSQLYCEGQGYLLFDSEEECEKAFWSTVGDDGPTKTNPYNGPVRVYAVTCGPDGQLYHENT